MHLTPKRTECKQEALLAGSDEFGLFHGLKQMVVIMAAKAGERGRPMDANELRASAVGGCGQD